jgi:hypothetical protein
MTTSNSMSVNPRRGDEARGIRDLEPRRILRLNPRGPVPGFAGVVGKRERPGARSRGTSAAPRAFHHFLTFAAFKHPSVSSARPARDA